MFIYGAAAGSLLREGRAAVANFLPQTLAFYQRSSEQICGKKGRL